jgi:hypothetical protein
MTFSPKREKEGAAAEGSEDEGLFVLLEEDPHPT